MNRLAILNSTAEALDRHLRAAAPSEEGAFCLLREGKWTRDVRLLATDLLLPPPGAWESQGRDHLRPSAQWISAAISRAIRDRAGLLFVHSHPEVAFPRGFSPADNEAFGALAPVLADLLEGPVGAAVVHPSGWFASVWSRGGSRTVENVVAIGKTLRFLSPMPSLPNSLLDVRQRDALGHVHEVLQHLHVAVVGCGGIGSPLAEQLVRMGVGKLVLVDRDLLDTPSNVRRIFGSRVEHLKSPTPPAKVDLVADHLKGLGLGVEIEVCHGDVRTETVFRRLLDVDVVLCGTDSHGSRAVMNDLPSTYLLPVIDVGVRVGSRDEGSLAGLTAEVRVLTPSTPCLWCRGAISGETIRVENLPADERGKLERDGYVIRGSGDPAPSVVALTVLASGMASCALLTLLSEEGDVAPSGYLFDGLYGDAYQTEPKVPVAECRCQRSVGLGDIAQPPFIDR